MELDLGPELERFRGETREWIGAHRHPELATLDERAALTGALDRAGEEQRRAYADWERALVEARLMCPQWPAEVGGRGLSGVQMAIFNEELAAARMPRVTRGMGESLVGPSVIVHGTDDQKAHFLPRIISGEDRYCQGFSEPDAGSDLGSVTTRGIVDGDEVVITGQKIWTSGAHRANMIFIVCRTDPDAPKHRGLSYVLTPLHDNNIELRPLPQMSGVSGFSQEFIDGARAPLFNVIGGLGGGWRVAMTTLGNERGGMAATQHLRFEREFWALTETARKRDADRDPLVRQQLAWSYTHVQLMRYAGLRLLANLAASKEPGPESSITKLFWSEYHKRLGEIAVGVVGPDALLRPAGPGYPTDRWQDVLLSSRAGTIYSGTSQIQRRIIGERALGLPREPAGARG